MANYPTHHARLTEAMNKIGDACCVLEQALYTDSTYKPLLEAARRTHKRLYARYEKNIKRGRKEGWFK